MPEHNWTEQELWERREVYLWLTNDETLYRRFLHCVELADSIGVNEATNLLCGMMPAVGHLGVPFKWVYLRYAIVDWIEAHPMRQK